MCIKKRQMIMCVYMHIYPCIHVSTHTCICKICVSENVYTFNQLKLLFFLQLVREHYCSKSLETKDIC